MSNPVVLDDGRLVHTIGFEYKQGLGNYSSTTASTWLSVPLAPDTPLAEQEQALKEHYVLAKSVVAQQLGLENHIGEDGVVVLLDAFPHSTVQETKPKGGGGNYGGQSRQKNSPPRGGGGNGWVNNLAYPDDFDPDNAACPNCGGDMYDNRPGHGSQWPAKSPKQPMFKCCDRDCGGAVWGYVR